jgi:hypothetical protein
MGETGNASLKGRDHPGDRVEDTGLDGKINTKKSLKRNWASEDNHTPCTLISL